MTACHVVFKVPDGNHRSSGLYEVTVHIKMPGGTTVDIDRTPGLDERFSDPQFAVGDAFRRARRRLQDRAKVMRQEVKSLHKRIHGARERAAESVHKRIKSARESYADSHSDADSVTLSTGAQKLSDTRIEPRPADSDERAQRVGELKQQVQDGKLDVNALVAETAYRMLSGE
jgi:anti-sigma28 factor (negative regulator of flagellin synthesis)